MESPDLVADVKPFLELSRSAWTVVYKAYQASLDRFVLLKVVNPDARHDEEMTARFEEEARLMARIQHPNVVSVYGFGRSANGAYFTAEFVEGLSLANLLSDHRLPASLALYILSSVVAGLRAAHAEGIFHRDLKPANILLSHEGQVKIADFGMASLQEREGGKSEIRGTLAYMAPEYLMDPVPTARSDLFSLGATFFEMLAGHPAFAGKDASSLIDAVLNYEPTRVLDANPYVPASMKAVCVKLLAKSPGDRYASAPALAADLEHVWRDVRPAGAAELKAFLEDPEGTTAALQLPPARVEPPRAAPVHASPPPVRELSQPARPRRVSVAAWMGVTLLILAFSIWSFGRGEPERGEGPGMQPPDSLVVEVDTPANDSMPALAARPVETRDLRLESTRPAETSVAPREAVPTVPDPRQPAEADTASSVPVIEAPPALAHISVTCTPYCDVFVGDDSLGTAPPARSLAMEAGTYAVVLRHPTFPPYRTTVELTPGQSDTLNVSLWRSVATLDLDVIPWAKVYIDSAYVDDTPLENPIILWPGEHRLALELPGLGRWETTLVVKAGEVIKKAYKMQELLSN